MTGHVEEAHYIPRPPRPGELNALIIRHQLEADKSGVWWRSRRTARQLSRVANLQFRRPEPAKARIAEIAELIPRMNRARLYSRVVHLPKKSPARRTAY